MRQWFVPPKSTSMTLGVQSQLFFCTIVAIGKTVWQDSGFAELFLFTTVRLYRYVYVCSRPFIIYFYLPNIEIFDGTIQYKSSTIFFLNLIYKYSVQIFKRNIQVIFFPWNFQIFSVNIQYKYSVLFFFNAFPKYSVEIFNTNIPVVFFLGWKFQILGANIWQDL